MAGSLRRWGQVSAVVACAQGEQLALLDGFKDGLTQVEAAHLLGQHKSWVCRRLALLEKLSDEVKEELRLGLVGPSLARQLTRLPAGNQQAVLALTRQQTLTAEEVTGLIDLLQGASPEQAAFVLSKPRQALA